MKNNLLLSGKGILKCFLAMFIVSLLFNGCKKDSKMMTASPSMPDNIAKAKIWYESNYPVVASSKTTINGIRTLDTKPKTGPIDFTQFINPDWYHPASYNRLNKDVVELPIAPGSQLNSVLKNMGNKTPSGNKDYSRSSFLILQDEQGYKAYIMTIIADSSYVRGDTSKLSHNTYRKHDPDFSGLVLYFTPKGEYVNGYKYLNGKISTGSSQQNKTTSSLKTNQIKVNTEMVCEDWYLVTWVDGEIVDVQYLYTECTGGGDEGGGGPPSPCQGSNSINDKKKILTENPDDNPGDGGMGSPGNPCSVGGGGSTPNFGLDASHPNMRVADDMLDDLLAYAESIGLNVSSAFNTVLTVNGVSYIGQIREIYNSSNQVVAAYFSPNASSSLFQTGINYSIGNGSNTSYTSAPSNNFNGINFGNSAPEITNTGGTVSYPGPSNGSGGYLTPSQRELLENNDDNRIVSLLEQEDNNDDDAPSPCHGTGRSGNVAWKGTVEHWLIQADYMASQPNAFREYYVPGSSSQQNGRPGYADLINTATSEMFEIKPDNENGRTLGANEIQIYVNQANALCAAQNGVAWHGGTNYTTRSLFNPKDPTHALIARLNSDGVIVYSSQVPGNGIPSPVPVALPQNLADKLKKFLHKIALNPYDTKQQILTFLRDNPQIVPYLKGAAAAIVIGTIIEDIVTEGIGVADDYQSFLIARMLWRISNEIVLY